MEKVSRMDKVKNSKNRGLSNSSKIDQNISIGEITESGLVV